MHEILQFIFYIFCAVAGYQLLHILFFYVRLAMYKKPVALKKEFPPVSVIICARNEDTNLKKNIPVLLKQDYPQFEIIIVDDNSEDGTLEYLFYLTQKEPRIKRVRVGEINRLMAGKKFPLTLGIKAAAYDTLVLTDADCYPASNQWLKKIISSYTETTEIILGYGAYQKEKGFLNKIIRFETVNTALNYFSYSLAKIPYMGVGRNLSYKKELFFDYGGFADHREIPSGDDDLFINKAANKKNTRICIDADAFTLSAPKQTLDEWQEQKIRHLSTGKYYKLKHKLFLTLYVVTQTGMWFLFFILLGFLFNWYIVVGIIIARWIILRIIISAVLKKLNEKDLNPYIELFDCMQVFYYFRFAKAALFKTRYRWN